jgi:hypothetical protein
MWMHPGRIYSHSKCLRVKEKVTNSQNGPGMRQKQREEKLLFLFPGVFKAYANLWEEKNLSDS